MAFPVLAAVIGAGIGALYTKASGGSNRDMLKNMLIGGALGTGAGYMMPGTFGAPALKGGVMSSTGQMMSVPGAVGKEVGMAATLKNLSPATKIAGGIGAASLLASGPAQQATTPKPPFTEDQYSAEYEKQRENVEGLGRRFDYAVDRPDNMQQIYNFTEANPMFRFAQGGIAEIPTYAEGGVNYLPSKLDHDEKDTANYVRASGYIEDATDIADKDKDTMLAQLADGEFVSRADAVLGAGIMQGADPKDAKEMRKMGAKFFYSQQDQLKRIYDMVS